MNNSKLVDYAKESARVSKSKSKKEKSPPIRKCSYSGCPMNASLNVGGRDICSFHETPDFHQDVTQAINDNLNLIKAHSKMIKWSVGDWAIVVNRKWLSENNVCPIKENESSSEYINRYFSCLCDKIKEEAATLATNRLNNNG